MNLGTLNQQLAEHGIPEIALVAPADCLPQKMNARYMNSQTMRNLTDNVKRDGRLESVPLVAPSKQGGKHEIISGHHRVEAAKAAGLAKILVMVIHPKGRDELLAKQLSHNAITGQDDEAVLAKLYSEIETLEQKYYSGLQDALGEVEFTSLSFRAGEFREFVVAFLPEQIERFDAACSLAEDMHARSASVVRLASIETWDTFAGAIRKVKRAEDIRSSAAALGRLVELALERLAEVAADGQTGKAPENRRQGDTRQDM